MTDKSSSYSFGSIVFWTFLSGLLLYLIRIESSTIGLWSNIFSRFRSSKNQTFWIELAIAGLVVVILCLYLLGKKNYPAAPSSALKSAQDQTSKEIHHLGKAMATQFTATDGLVRTFGVKNLHQAVENEKKQVGSMFDTQLRNSTQTFLTWVNSIDGAKKMVYMNHQNFPLGLNSSKVKVLSKKVMQDPLITENSQILAQTYATPSPTQGETISPEQDSKDNIKTQLEIAKSDFERVVGSAIYKSLGQKLDWIKNLNSNPHLQKLVVYVAQDKLSYLINLNLFKIFLHNLQIEQGLAQEPNAQVDLDKIANQTVQDFMRHSNLRILRAEAQEFQMYSKGQSFHELKEKIPHPIFGLGKIKILESNYLAYCKNPNYYEFCKVVDFNAQAKQNLRSLAIDELNQTLDKFKNTWNKANWVLTYTAQDKSYLKEGVLTTGNYEMYLPIKFNEVCLRDYRIHVHTSLNVSAS